MSQPRAIFEVLPEERFTLDPTFVQAFHTLVPPFGPLGEVTYRRTYARTKPDGTNEEWWETVQRVVNGTYTVQKRHCLRSHLPWSDAKAQDSAQEMYRLIFEMKFLPPGRGLWMMGTPYVERMGGAALNNCAMVTTAYLAKDFADPFCFLMDFSMLGVGVGGDTRGAGSILIFQPKQTAETFVVEDSREGWVALVRRILNSYVGLDSFPLTIDYRRVRPAGTIINGFGGVASGPGPLQDLVHGICDTLNPLIHKPITAEAIVDLFTRIGKCVVAGNVRRSAIIMLGDKDDETFAALKNPEQNAAALLSHRWASNNSIFAEVGMDYRPHAANTAANGEPGYFWLDNARAYGRMSDPPTHADAKAIGTNPCSEQTLESHELCCLVETFPSRHESYDQFQRTLKFAYLYAKTVTLIPTHNPKVNSVMLRNRRIGCSMSGIIDAFVKHGKRECVQWMDDGYAYLRRLDTLYSDWLGIPKSVKITSVKPSGTVSLLPGVSPGIHYPHAEYYWRTIRLSAQSTLVPALRHAGYRIEPSLTDRNTLVVYFPIHEAHFDRAKEDVSLWEQLENAALVQAHWADNQVSITVTFKADEAKDIRHALEFYETRLKSVSFLPLVDHQYAQAPYQTIDRTTYEQAIASIAPVNWHMTQHDQMDMLCDGDVCLIPQ